jgi:hypothetical protein
MNSRRALGPITAIRLDEYLRDINNIPPFGLI